MKSDVFAGEANEKVIAMFLVLADYWSDNDPNTGLLKWVTCRNIWLNTLFCREFGFVVIARFLEVIFQILEVICSNF